MARTDNVVTIDAPMDLVWDMTNDIEKWPSLFSEYQSAEILDRTGDRVRFRLTTRPDEQGYTWSWVSERTPDPATRTVDSHRVETGPFEWMRIRWEYTPAHGGVAMRWVQEFQMKPGAPMTEQVMRDRLNTSTVEQMARIKRLVEQEARASRAVGD